MSQAKKQLRLGAFLMAGGHHVAAWRHPGVPADAGLNLEHYKEVVLAAAREVRHDVPRG
jgi:hypothetical protein